jgi:putative hemolysin
MTIGLAMTGEAASATFLHTHLAAVMPSVFDGIRHGPLEVRIAREAAEVTEAQRLRYRVFYEEMTAKPTPEMQAIGLDFDKYDTACDHLLVLHHADVENPASKGTIIGTYRLLRRSAAAQVGGFYTAGEFDISKLEAVEGEIMELGRACVDARFRSRPTMQLLWRGIASYVLSHRVQVMFGCASLPGTDVQALAPLLSYLHYNHLAPETIRATALPERYIRMDLISPREINAEEAVAALSDRASLSALPPLIKGYLRLGGMIGEGAVIDPEFDTTDVCIIVVTDRLAEKYFNHFLRNGS